MRQTVMRLTPVRGKHSLDGTSWRQVAGYALGRKGIGGEAVRQLFNHPSDAQSTPLGRLGGAEPAGVCFTATSRHLEVVATGGASAALLSEFALELVLAAQGAIGPCAVEHFARDVGFVDGDGRIYAYSVPKFVASRGLHPNKDHAWAQMALVRGLQRWADRCEIEITFASSDFLIERVIHKSPALTRSACGSRWARDRVAIEFCMPILLRGLWFVGGLAGKGYGQVHLRDSSAALRSLRLAA